MDDEVVCYVEENNLLQIRESVESGTQTIIEAVETYNQNYINGVLGIVGCLGFLFGALLGGVYVRIFGSK